MDDDCFAARLAAAFRRRFGHGAGERAALRLSRAVSSGDIVKTDLFVAVDVILRDDRLVFSRSRA